MSGEDVEFAIRAQDKSGPAVKQAADGLDKLGDKADKAQRKVDDLGDETGQLARKLAEARVAAAALAREFDKSGDAKILKDFEKINREASRLGRVAKTLKFDPPKIKNPDGFFGDIINMARRAGFIAGDFAVEGFGDAFKGLGTAGPTQSYIIAGLVGAAAAAAPEVAGAVEGAVLAGVATGGIAAGLIIGAKDPRVTAAYTTLGQQIFTQLKADASPFASELLAVAPKLGKAFDAEEPRIQRTFAKLAPIFGDLTDDALDAVHKIMPSIERAAVVGGHILADVGQQLPALAGDVGDLLDAFSAGGRGASAAIGLLVFQLRGMVELLALGARGSAPFLNLFGKLVELTNFTPSHGGLEKQLSDIPPAAAQAAGAYNNLASSMGNTADKAQALDDAFNRLFSAQMGLDQANLAVKQGLLNVKEAVKENGKTLDDTSQKGLNNIAVIQQQIQNYDQQRQAAIAAGNGTAEATAAANAAYEQNVASLRSVLIQMGLNADQVDKLIAKYQSIPKDLTTTITTVYRTIGKPGQSDQSTGHSRNGASADTSAGLGSWAPARYADAQRAEMRGESGGGTFRTGGPTEVHSEVAVTVLLDGQAIQPRIERTVKAARDRDAWRAKVGRR